MNNYPTLHPAFVPHAGKQNATSRFGRAELLLLLSLFLAIFEGAARKWLFAGSPVVGYVLYFSKDLAFASIILLCGPAAVTPATALFRKYVIVGTVLTLCGAVAAALSEINWVGAVLTLRATVFLPLVAALAASRLANVNVSRVGWMLGVCTLINFGLGTVQSALSGDHILNTYADSALDVVVIGDNVRASGTFSYISGLGVICVFGVWAGMVLFSTSLRFGLWFGAATVVAGLGCGLVSISRAPIATGLLMLALWTVFSGLLLKKGLLAVPLACGMAVLLVASGISEKLQQYTNTLIERHVEAREGESLADRTVDPLLATFEVASMAPFGRGLGTEQVAAVWATTGTANLAHFEGPWPRLVLETGIFGVLGFAITCGGALFALFLAAKSTGSLEGHGVAIATLLLAGSFILTNIIYNHVSSGMLWPVIAAVLGATTKADRAQAGESNQTHKPGCFQNAS